jgi:hypothetical protein
MCFFNEYVPWVEEAHLQVTRYKAHFQVTRYKALYITWLVLTIHNVFGLCYSLFQPIEHHPKVWGVSYVSCHLEG